MLQVVYKSRGSQTQRRTDVRIRKGDGMGINRWSGGIEERKRNETDATAGDELPKERQGDASSRLEASEGPAEDPE